MKAKELLKLLGLSDDRIEQLTSTDPEVTKKVNVKEIRDELVEKSKEALKADEGFLGALKVEIRGEVFGPRERKARKLLEEYVTDEEYNALKPETRLDDLLALGIKKIKEKVGMSSDDKDKEIVRLRDEVKTAKERAKKLEEEDLPKVRQEVDLEKDNLHLERNMLKLLSKKKLIIDPEDAIELVSKYINELADVKIKDKKPVVFQKGKDLELFKDNNKVTLDSLIDEAVVAKKLLAQSNKTEKTEKTEPAPGREGRTGPPGAAKAAAHAETYGKKEE